MKKIAAIIKPFNLDEVKKALQEAKGSGRQNGPRKTGNEKD
jgi:nitrogen regulatory protein PII